MYFNPSLNHGALKAQEMQKLRGKEKEPEQTAQGNTNGNNTQVAQPKGEQVNASVLDVMAQQNMGLGIVNKTQATEGAMNPKNGIIHLPGYDELVARWNKNSGDMDYEAKMSLLEEIIAHAGNDTEAINFWRVTRRSVHSQECLNQANNFNLNPNSQNDYNNLENLYYSIIDYDTGDTQACIEFYNHGSREQKIMSLRAYIITNQATIACLTKMLSSHIPTGAQRTMLQNKLRTQQEQLASHTQLLEDLLKGDISQGQVNNEPPIE